MTTVLSELKVLLLEEKIKECKMMVYVLEFTLLNGGWPKLYVDFIKNEISNNNAAIEDYQKQIKAL